MSVVRISTYYHSSYADLPQNAPGPQFASDSVVYNHYSDPSDIILSKPVNKYLKEHNTKYYNTNNEPSYHYTIGRDGDGFHKNHNFYEDSNDVSPPVKTKTYDFVIGEDATTNRPDIKKLYQPKTPIGKNKVNRRKYTYRSDFGA